VIESNQPKKPIPPGLKPIQSFSARMSRRNFGSSDRRSRGAEQAGLVEFSPFMAAHVGTVISLAARHNVPAIFEATLPERVIR
jgi:hypothetical protein